MKAHIDSFRATWTQDLSAGLVVFLVALPLCLGIAMASDAPLMSGMITGIIAGVLVAWLSGSTLSVSGPAAGLTIIVARAIHELGTFDRFLTAVLLSGVIQVIFGVLRAGTLSGFFPNSVIRGMLAGIGVIIILKQIPHALGVDADYEGDMNFWQITDNKNTFSEIMASFGVYHWNAALVALLCLGIMIFWPQIQAKAKNLKYVPASLVTVAFGIFMTFVFNTLGADFAITAEHLVQLPGGIQALLQEIRTPLFSAITDPTVLKVAATLAIVGSIESLLSLEATDKLDPERRVSSPNRELLAQGVGNILAGLLGGIPMTAVIVRSSANVYAGAKSRLSCFIHGIFLLLASLVLYPLINQIPLAALAAVLFLIGYKLTHPSSWKEMYNRGADQFLPFALTVFAVVFTDLLTGVGLGLIAGLVMVLRNQYYGTVQVVNDGKDYLIRFTRDVSFANKAKLRKALRRLPEGANVIIDGSRAIFIDRDIYEMIMEFSEGAKYRKIKLELKDIRGKDGMFGTLRRKRIHGSTETSYSQQPRVG